MPEKRLEVIKEIKKKCPQIQVGVSFIPIIPFLGDSEENMEGVTSAAREAEADFILFGGSMTLRDSQAAWFMEKLSQKFPNLVTKYEELYQGKYEPQKRYLRQIHRTMLGLCEKYRLNFRLKRYIPQDFRRQNYIVAQRLLDESYLSQMIGKTWTKTFWAGQNINNLRESIEDVARRNKLGKIRNVVPTIEEYVLSLLRGSSENNGSSSEYNRKLYHLSK